MDFCFSFAHGDQKAVGGAHPGVHLTQMLVHVSFPGISRKSKKGFFPGDDTSSLVPAPIPNSLDGDRPSGTDEDLQPQTGLFPA